MTEQQADLTPLHCQDELLHQPHWWKADFRGPRYQCPGSKPKFEYQTAFKASDGSIERVGVSSAEDEYDDARQRVMGEYYDIKRDEELFGQPGEVVLLRRPVAAWEVAVCASARSVRRTAEGTRTGRRTTQRRSWSPLMANDDYRDQQRDELKTPDEWSKLEGVEILDPDGWRGRNGRPWTDPISLAEFQERLRVCTQRSLRVPDDRAEMQERRNHGLAARHETRVERAIRRQVAEEIAAEIDHFQKALEDAYAKRGNIADDLRADAAEYCATIARSIGIREAS